MAPGVFCVWSRADPEGDTAAGSVDSDAENEAEELFTDDIAKLSGVSRGVRFARGETQSVEEPYTHQVPYLSMYELPDAAYAEDRAFQQAAAQCAFKETDTFKPRVYEEIERQEAEDFEGVIGELVTIVTAEGVPEQIDEAFWKFHREEFVGSFMQAPEFIRCQVFRMVGDVDPDIAQNAPAGPLLILYHWDCVEVPWTEIIAAAQTEGYVKFLESGIKWQGVNYHPMRWSEEQPPRRFSMYGADSTFGGEEEELIDGGDGWKAETEPVDLDEKRKSRTAIEPETAEMQVKMSSDDAAASIGFASADPKMPVSNGTTRKERADTVVSDDVSDPKLNGAMRSLSFRELTKPTENGQDTKPAASADADANEMPVFLSVRDRIRAWEKSGNS